MDFNRAKQELANELMAFIRDNPAIPYKKMGAKFGISHQLVYYYAKKAGIRRQRGRKVVRHG